MASTNQAAMALGDNIKTRREKTGMSQRQMAKKLHIQQATWHKIESGKRIPTAEQAKAISIFFEGELSELHLLMPDRYPAPSVAEEAA